MLECKGKPFNIQEERGHQIYSKLHYHLKCSNVKVSTKGVKMMNAISNVKNDE